MSRTRRIAHNFIIQIIGRVLALVLGIVIVSLLMCYLGPRDYGYYTIAVAYLQIFGIVADFGFYLITLRYLGELEVLLPKQRRKKIRYVMGNIFTLRLISALLFYGGAWLAAWLFNFPLTVKLAVGVMSGSFFFCTLIQALSAFYQKILQTKTIFLAEVIGKSTMLGLILFFISREMGFYWVIGIYLVGNFFNFLFLLLRIGRWVSLRLRFDFSFWKEIIRQAWPVGLAIVFNVVYFKADTLILSIYHPPEQVGLYGACYRILEVLITIPPLFIGLVFSRMVEVWKRDYRERFAELVQRSFDFLLMIALPIVFGTAIVGRKLMLLLGGQQFVVSGDILKILIVACGILFVGELFKHLAVGLGLAVKILPFYLITALLAVVGYFVFIPRYSYWGAAWVTLASESLMFIFSYLLIKRATGFSLKLNFLAKSLAACLGMFGLLWLVRNWNLFSLLGIGLASYLGLLYLLKGLPLNLIREIVRIRQ